jgi:hypothetical protein
LTGSDNVTSTDETGAVRGFGDTGEIDVTSGRGVTLTVAVAALESSWPSFAL